MDKRFTAILMLGDILFAFFALCVASSLRFWPSVYAHPMVSQEGTKSFVLIAVFIFSSFLIEIYTNEIKRGRKEIIIRVYSALAVSFLILSALYYMLPDIMFGRRILFLSLIVFGALQMAWHIGYTSCLNIPGMAKRVLILGTGPLARQIGEIIASTNHRHLLSGYVSLESESVLVPSGAILGNIKGLVETVKEEKVHKLVVSLAERRGIFPLEDVLNCKFNGVEVIDAPSFYEELTGKLLLENMNPSSFIFCQGFKLNAPLRVYKRVFDVFFSVITIILVAPLIPLIALMIKLDSRGPVFFRQLRVGAKEKQFVLYKFRTMREDAESTTGAVWSQKNDPRITRIGRFLRKARLDEIPQLYNVLRGDMSFIGPRPERPEFIEALKELIPYYSERHFVKPGITGWAQVKYSYGSSIEDTIEKLRYDLFYIKHVSLFFDLLIIMETIKVVMFGRGAR
jgi:sugar transferase (PEP-CTERM system associated)